MNPVFAGHIEKIQIGAGGGAKKLRQPYTPKTKCNICSSNGWSFFDKTRKKGGLWPLHTPPLCLPLSDDVPERSYQFQVTLKIPVVGHNLFFLSFWTECKYGLMIKFFRKCFFWNHTVVFKTRVDAVFSLSLKIVNFLWFNLKVFIVLICPFFPN